MPRKPRHYTLDPANDPSTVAVPARRMSRKRRKRLIVTISVTVAAALVAAVGVVAFAINNVTSNITRSDFTLPNVPTPEEPPTEQNILIMGMDSRLDQNGNPLPGEVYDALRAGNAEDGGYNANVLMLLHIPADRSQAVGISIPRDDYVEIPGAPLGVTNTKIKEAYGLAMQEKLNELTAEGTLSEADAYQEARAAGRQAQIETVSHFMGDVRIDHFVEMTMGGFYYVAQAVQPITVCLNQATEDSYSGAKFDAGVQQLGVEDSMSFVRQRRDTSGNGPFLTDLDRSRRQQAFIIGLAEKLKDQSTLLQPKTIFALADVTKNHVALDTGFDVLKFVKMAHDVAQTGVRFVTLPIVEFGNIDGAAVNIVDVDEVHRVVASVLDGSYFAQPETPAGGDGAPADGSAVDPAAGADGAPGADGADGADGANGADGADGTPAPPAGPKRNEAGMPSYESWDEPIMAGGIPCVN